MLMLHQSRIQITATTAVLGEPSYNQVSYLTSIFPKNTVCDKNTPEK